MHYEKLRDVIRAMDKVSGNLVRLSYDCFPPSEGLPTFADRSVQQYLELLEAMIKEAKAHNLEITAQQLADFKGTST